MISLFRTNSASDGRTGDSSREIFGARLAGGLKRRVQVQSAFRVESGLLRFAAYERSRRWQRGGISLLVF
jgi:hypothetical protein